MDQLQIQTVNYRKDIDGLRAIAVLAVVLFHMGYLPNGYLGVDIFYAISGFLITRLVFNEANKHSSWLFNFYLRRIRRIIPLVLFTSLMALIIGLFVMLPDDLENLSQSVFATNLFTNNILLLITTGNYWEVANDFKPLMHTWSLGVEEQFYLFYPLIFLFLSGKRVRYIVPILAGLTLFSLTLFCLSTNEASKFYSIQFRFFELSLGGLGALFFKDLRINAKYGNPLIFILLIVLLFDLHLSADLKLIIIVVSSVGLLISGRNKLSETLLENNLMTGIGKISFSLYMWHQIVLAYERYFITDRTGIFESLCVFAVVLSLSIFSYYAIEKPFRDKNRVKTTSLLWIVGIVLIIACSSSYYIYSIGGIIRDVPELDLKKSANSLNNGNGERNIHIAYNARIYDLNKQFTDNDKIKVLVIGNSMGRDFANILLESKFKDLIEISYAVDIDKCRDITERIRLARFIFFENLDYERLVELAKKINIDTAKVWNVGTKNFGYNNGLFYNHNRTLDYCNQKTYMRPGYGERNQLLKNEWGSKYIDIIGTIVDQDQKVPVFTPDCKFISQDCRHLTRAGAVYLAQRLDLDLIFVEKDHAKITY